MAFTYSWTSIPDSDTDPDSPLTTNLVTGMNHNLTYLREWIGKDYYAGAVENHTHDGTNSAIVTVTGASLYRSHDHEIYDHFMYATSWLTNTGNPNWSHSGGTGTTTTTGLNSHYAVFINTADTMTGRGIFRIEMIKLVLEFGMKIGTAGTSWGTNNRMGIRGSTRGADFINAGVADKVRCQTRGSGGGGTQNTDVTVPGAGVDDWHRYKIDLTGATSTVFSIDGTVVATHSTTIPDAQDLSVDIGGDNSIDMWIDFVKLYSTAEPSLSTA